MKGSTPISPRQFTDFTNKLQFLGVNTICDAALCINRPECYRAGQVTFLIMGKVCTRRCRYCAVNKGNPEKLDPLEPKKIAQAIGVLKLKYVVLTSVNRDDLPDQGANHFKAVVDEIRRQHPDVKLELLIPDFWGKEELLRIIVKTKPEVLNHNIESTRNRFKFARPIGDYDRSLRVLKTIKKIDRSLVTKFGFMVGLGETMDDIKRTIIDLQDNLVDIITVGQYLNPYKRNIILGKIYEKHEYDEIREFAKSLNHSKYVFVGPNVRSSYHAGLQVSY